MNEPTRRLVSSPSRPLASETSRILFLSIASARSTADADWPSTLRTLRVRRLDRGLALLNRPRIAVGGEVARGADGAEKGRQRCEQAGDPIAETVDDCIEVASGVGGEGEQDREQNRRTARQERPEAGSMKSLHVLRIPLEEAKTNGLDRTLCARCPHAELKRPPTVGELLAPTADRSRCIRMAPTNVPASAASLAGDSPSTSCGTELRSLCGVFGRPRYGVDAIASAVGVSGRQARRLIMRDPYPRVARVAHRWWLRTRGTAPYRPLINYNTRTKQWSGYFLGTRY